VATTLRARVLVLPAYIERSYADVLLSDGGGRIGYLLKDWVASLDVLVYALRTEVVAQLLVAPGLTRWRRSRRRSAMCSDLWPWAAATPRSPTPS
jgi:hypothetical protein